MGTTKETISPMMKKTKLTQEKLFNDDEVSHCFIGPSTTSLLERVLHQVRTLDVVGTPRFRSKRTDEADTSISQLKEESTCGDIIEVVFEEEHLHLVFKYENDEDETDFRVLVASIDDGSVADKAGVTSDSLLISMNGEAIKPDMTIVEFETLLVNATVPKRFNFLRITEEDDSIPIPIVKRKSFGFGNSVLRKISSNKTIMGTLQRTGTLDKIQGAKSYMGTVMMQSKKATKVNENTVCAGCDVSPIIGELWTCSICTGVSLCDNCYGEGLHGFETSKLMDTYKEVSIESQLKKRCKKFTSKFLACLRKDVCQNRLEKFEYIGTWIADIIDSPPSKIRVRGLQIPGLKVPDRQNFVGMLMQLTQRTDIDVNIEWLPDEKTEGSEKVRIWISDKKERIKSPFDECSKNKNCSKI